MVAGLTWGVGVFIAALLWRMSHWWIAGDDAWYHIRVAADLREQAAWYLETLDWTRMSVFREGWGDKEYLFHLFLMPFAGGDLLLGAKAALALLNGITAGLLAFFGVRYGGRMGWLVPLMAVAMTAAFPVRLEQLRPHNLSLILLLFMAAAAASRRTWWLVALGALYALSYTAWHLPVILGGLLFFGFLVLRKERRWELVWPPGGGILIGVLVHPGFPDNVRIWSLQNVEFFLARSALPVGTEIFGRSWAAFAVENWRIAALVALGAAFTWPWSSRHRATDQEITFGVFAVATSALYVGAQRFAEYAIPFLALYLTIVASRFARSPQPVRVAVLAAGIALGGVQSVRTTAAVVTFNHQRYGFASLDEMIGFRQALPAGAHVASTWDFTPFYYYAAPRSAYLNVLDPLFMWKPYPESFRDLESMFAGTRVDVPEVLVATLGSDYIAYHRQLFPDLATRIEHDPRLQFVFQSSGHVVARVDTAGSHGFVTDWSLMPATDTSLAAFLRERDAGGLPRIERKTLRVRGLVAPVSEGGCWWASWTAPSGSPDSLGFGSLGRSSVYLNGELVYHSDVGHAGLIDAVSIKAPSERRRGQDWVVHTCPDSQYGSGFFLRIR